MNKFISTYINKLGLSIKESSYFYDNGFKTYSELCSSQLMQSFIGWPKEQSSVIHFTGVKSALSILKSGYLRGSNFNKFRDTSELNVGTEFLNYNVEDSWEETKKLTFALSFTPLTDNNNYHWINYANNHKGVGLEFEIDFNHKPYDIYALKVHYIESKDFDFAEKNKITKSERNYLTPLLAGFKHHIGTENNSEKHYNKEKEYRLVYCLDKDLVEVIYEDKFLERIRPVDNLNHTDLFLDEWGELYWYLSINSWIKLKRIHFSPVSTLQSKEREEIISAFNNFKNSI